MFPADAKIMIVDDSSFARGSLKSGLKELKYWKILEAGDARSAQSILLEGEQQTDPVQLLFTDLHMPDLGGLALLKWVRGQEKLKDMPVIVLTSSQEKSEILEAGKLGVSHYMIKPFDIATLKNKLTTTWVKHGEKFSAALKSAKSAN